MLMGDVYRVPGAGVPDPLKVAILRQQWRDIAFLHWRVDPGAVAPLLPAGTRPDVFDGSSWVGLIPFRMVGLGVGRGPALPWLGSFAELNVRLYSVDEAGNRGVVFRSLEAERLGSVLAARAGFGLNYTWADMSVAQADGAVTYSSVRRWPEAQTGGVSRPAAEIRVRPGAPIAEPDPLSLFLTARWGLHTRRGGRLLYLPNHHEAWPLREASVEFVRDDLVAAAGLPGVTDRAPDSVLFSDGVTTEFGLPRIIR
jgi:uncharacterized protein YqjF (DUF2071 family)